MLPIEEQALKDNRELALRRARHTIQMLHDEQKDGPDKIALEACIRIMDCELS